MVNFRYHVVSLVAVFLALGVGIIMGSTVIDDEIVKRLNGDLNDFKARNAELRADNNQLNGRLGFWDNFSQAFVPQLVRGKLSGRTLVIVSQDGLDGKAVDLASDTLVQAGAAKPARVMLTKKWLLPDAASVTQLAGVIGDSSEGKSGLQRAGGDKLGTRLATSGDPKAGEDLLSRLAGAGFLRLADVPRGSFPAPGSLVVALSVGDAEQSPRAQDLLVPLVQALAATRPVVVGEPLGSRDSVTDRVRGERTLAGVVPTVDHADTGPGRLSLVWALRDLLDGRKVPHYGTHRGTDGLMPMIA
jgi:hypothetical protein